MERGSDGERGGESKIREKREEKKERREEGNDKGALGENGEFG